MIKEQVTLDEAISFLNELIKIDANAVACLIANRVPCNEELANHPTVKCSAQHGGFHTGMLEIINGMFGSSQDDHYPTGWGPIMFVFEDGSLVRVERSVIEQDTGQDVRDLSYSDFPDKSPLYAPPLWIDFHS